MRDHPPCATATHQVKDRIDDVALWIAWRTPQLGIPRDERLKQSPFFVGQITWIVFTHPKHMPESGTRVQRKLRL